MELVLIVVVILLIRYIVKFFVKATVGEHVANVDHETSHCMLLSSMQREVDHWDSPCGDCSRL